MPSTTIQSRISAFEALTSSTNTPASPASNVHRPGPKPPQAQTTSSHHLQPPLSPTLAALLSSQVTFTPSSSAPRSPSPSPPNLGRKTSLIDLRDWVLDDGPTPNSSVHLTNGHNDIDSTRTPTQVLFDNGREASSSHNVAAPANTPLINLESPPPKPKPKPKPLALSAKPSELKAPPLPPRKPSYTSLKSIASTSSSTSIPIQRNGSANAAYPPRRGDSLTVEHTYPPSRGDSESRARAGFGHTHASSISSFHSVSLSSDTDPSTPGSVSNFIATYPVDHDRESTFTSNASEPDSVSLDESFENVSTASLASPSIERMISLDWEKAMAKRNPIPPKLPQRPGSSKSSTTTYPSRPLSFTAGTISTPTSPRVRATLSTTSSSATIANMVRRPPPPPSASARSSDRSSIQSTATSFSLASSTTTRASITSSKLKRPTPVPPAARKRFESVFNRNVIQFRKAEKQKEMEKPPLLTPQEARRTRQAAGWRGLSVDLITAGDESPVIVRPEDARPDAEPEVDENVGPEERLDGRFVKMIWVKSGLANERLKEIWEDCDTDDQGSLDREQFIRGMWRIDEDLRKAQTQSQSLKKATSISFGHLGRKKTLPINAQMASQRPKPILR